MPVELLLPVRKIPAPKPPSRIALNMAFGVGAGAVLGDKSRYRSHGAITTATWAAGLHGYCLDFVPGNPDYVTIPAAHTHLDFTAEDFSLIARVNMDSLAGDRMLFTRGTINADGWYILLMANGQIQILTSQAAAFQQTRSPIGTIGLATDYTVGFSRSGASIVPYRNGIAVPGVPGVHIDPLMSVRPARIGINDNLVTNPFDGRIEFLRIFRGIALQTSEHLAWHNALA